MSFRFRPAYLEYPAGWGNGAQGWREHARAGSGGSVMLSLQPRGEDVAPRRLRLPSHVHRPLDDELLHGPPRPRARPDRPDDAPVP